MYNDKNFSVEDAIDSILNEETVGNFKTNGEFFGKTPKLTDTKNKVKTPKNICGTVFDTTIHDCCEEDEEQSIEAEIFDLFSNEGAQTLSIDTIVTYLGLERKRDIMRALQNLSNKKEITIDKNKMVSINYQEDAEEDSVDEAANAVDEILDQENNSSLDEISEKILDILDKTVSGSVSGMTVNEIYKAIKKEIFNISKPSVVNKIKELLKNGEITKGPVEGTLIINSSEKNTEENEEIPTGLNAGYGVQQPITNAETPDTLKAKGWKEQMPGIFVSPDGEQQYAITQKPNTSVMESKDFKINKIMNNSYKDDEFFRLCEEVDQEIDNIENGFDTADDDTTAGLDELSDDTEADANVAGEQEEYNIALTADEYALFKSIAEKLLAADSDADLDDTVDADIEDDGDYISDEATDEEANDDLMNGDEDEDIDFDDEEDAEETVDTDGASGTYDGSFSNGAPSLKKQTPSFGPNRRTPITSKHLNPKHGSVYDGSGRNGAPSLSKETPSFGPNRRGPVPSKHTSDAGTSRSLFD